MRLTLSSFLLAAVASAIIAFPAHAQSSAKPKPLGSGDKKFAKDAAEAQVEILQFTEITNAEGAPGSESVKTLNKALATDLTTAWGELGTIVQAKGMTMPDTKKSSGGKQALESLKKAEPAKFDKMYLKGLVKETKKASALLENGAKSVQDPELKAWAEKWAPGLKTHHEAIDKAEEEESKKK